MPKDKNLAKDDASDAESEAAVNKPRLMRTALAAAACCGAAGAASYMLTPASLFTAPESAAAGGEDHKPAAKSNAGTRKSPAQSVDKSGHQKKAGAKKTEGAVDAGASTFFVTGSMGVFTPRPIVVSLKPQGRVRYLKVILAVETTPESERAFIEGELRIIDTLTSYLRAVPVSALEDPAAMARIREQIGRRIAFIVDPAPVNAVLITDFILS